MSDYVIRPLNQTTWNDFEALARKHNGVWNGCWCTFFHAKQADQEKSWEGNRLYKKQLVEQGEAHAALVFLDDSAIGWCQYGSPQELPNISHRRQLESFGEALPDYRITCFFVDRDHRRKKVAATALRGALDLIAQSGGGVVEAYPYDVADKKATPSSLFNGTRQLFEQAGFEYIRPKGKHHCLMRKIVHSE